MTDKIIGMYVHQHWPYHYPYAARTWQLEDWEKYGSCLKELGYNALLFWPMLEVIPNPVTESDERNQGKHSKVVEIYQKELGMKVYLALCPNVKSLSEVASRTTTEDRHFFYCDTRVDPGDPAAVDDMIKWREILLQPYKDVDGITIIDSDPGGYPGSTNEEYVNLIAEHRKMFDRLNPELELIYWVHAGWEGYCRFYQTGEFEFGTEEEFMDTMQRVKDLNPEPWGIANGFDYAKKLGLEERVFGYNYGAIEGEPTFPFTNFGGDSAYEAGGLDAPRGVMGNAQNHCLQLPNTLAFVRGAQQNPIRESDYVNFANELIVGKGEVIVESWKALSEENSAEMMELAEKLKIIKGEKHQCGLYQGFLFGSPWRFLNDLELQLRMKAPCLNFCTATKEKKDYRDSLAQFVTAADNWQATHGYKNRWEWPELNESLKELNSPVVNAALTGGSIGKTGFDRVKNDYFAAETQTPQILAALKRFLLGTD